MNQVKGAACLICDRISGIHEETNPYVVAESLSGYVVIGDHQYYRGYSLFLSKIHAVELHELDSTSRKAFLEDMSEVAAAAFRAFQPRKMNYELLGNKDAHMHWHLFPRYMDDPVPEMPIWSLSSSIRNADSSRPDPETLLALRYSLAKELSVRKQFKILL
jgi:diadenosine tetraphosphate (Ap4A) HIT family hydrolase